MVVQQMIPGMKVQLNTITNASGSSLFTIDDSTQVSCSVYHTEVKPRQENSHRATIEVILKNEHGKTTHREKEYEHILHECLTYAVAISNYPRSLIRVVLHVTRSEGNQVLNGLLNASILALLNAGIAMKTLLGGVMFFNDNKDGSFAFFAYDKSQQLISSHVEGFLIENEKLLDEYVKTGAIISNHIFNFYRDTMLTVMN